LATSFRGVRRDKSQVNLFDTREISVFGCVVEAAECLGLAQSFLLQPDNANESDGRSRRLAKLNDEFTAWKRYLPEEMRLRQLAESPDQWECLDSDGIFAPQVITAHAMHIAAIIILNQGQPIVSPCEVNRTMTLISPYLQRRLGPILTASSRR